MAIVQASPSWPTETVPRMSGRNACQSVGSFGHQLARAVRVARTTLHDLDEAGLRRVPGSVDLDRRAVVEHRLVGEQRRHLLPPRRLLRPIAVLLRRLLRLEAGKRNQLAVLSHAGCAAQPAHGSRSHLRDPLVELRAHLRGIGHLALDHLHEHVELLPTASRLCPAVDSTLLRNAANASPRS